MLVDLSVADVMTRPVETISPDASLAAAASRLAEGYGSLVVAGNGDAAGILTKSDVVRAFATGDTEGAVADAMSAPALSVQADDDLADAAKVLGDADVGQVVVVDDAGDVVGVLSATTVVDYVPAIARRHAVPGAEDVPGAAGAGGVTADEAARAGERDRHEHVRRPGRVDTAYEESDWAFEWDGGDGLAVGNVARFSKPVTGSDVEEFAHATGDTNRLHLDDAFAEGTRFGRRIAHGVLTLGLVSAALARMPGAIVYLSQDCSYLAPVDLGERCMATCRVVDDLGDDKYRLDVQVQNGDGDTLLEGGSTVLVDDIPE